MIFKAFSACSVSSVYKLHQFSWVGELAGDGARGGGQRAGEERASALALPAFKIAIARAHGILPRLELNAVVNNTHARKIVNPIFVS